MIRPVDASPLNQPGDAQNQAGVDNRYQNFHQYIVRIDGSKRQRRLFYGGRGGSNHHVGWIGTALGRGMAALRCGSGFAQCARNCHAQRNSRSPNQPIAPGRRNAHRRYRVCKGLLRTVVDLNLPDRTLFIPGRFIPQRFIPQRFISKHFSKHFIARAAGRDDEYGRR